MPAAPLASTSPSAPTRASLIKLPGFTPDLLSAAARRGLARHIAIAGLLCLLLLAACQQEEEEHSAELFVFGTIVEVKLWGASPDQARRAFTELQQMFQGMHNNWHAWEPGRLVDINQAFTNGQAAEADLDIVEMTASPTGRPLPT